MHITQPVQDNYCKSTFIPQRWGSSLITTQIGQMDTEDDLNIWTLSVFIRRVKLPRWERKEPTSLYFSPCWMSLITPELMIWLLCCVCKVSKCYYLQIRRYPPINPGDTTLSVIQVKLVAAMQVHKLLLAQQVYTSAIEYKCIGITYLWLQVPHG